MASKLTPLMADAVSRAAADPAGTPLFGTKTEPGLFPATTAARPAARKCLDDGLLVVIQADPKGKTDRDVCAATAKGLQFLSEQSSPKQVLEDVCRVLEGRQAQVDELLATARRMADGLCGLRAVVAAVLPAAPAAASSPRPTARLNGTVHSNGTHTMTATLARPVAVPADSPDDLAGAVLAHLADWSSNAGAAQDCPLPDLYKSLSVREQVPTLGAFHDCLRALHAGRQVYLHPWTGPLYALPEPSCALLVGHEVAYYASVRNGPA